MEGWIKLHRELMDKPIWIESTPEQKTILITLLMMANHKENEWEWKDERYKIQPGQFITSLESIARNAGKGISIQNVRTALKRFEKYGFLTNESTNKNRLITIVNWGFYQSNDNEPNKQTNRQLTSNQQAANKQLTTNKNEKNDKNVKKYINDDDNRQAPIEKVTTNVFHFYEQNGFGALTPYYVEKINGWIDDFIGIGSKESEEIIIEAMKKTLEHSITNWKYTETILKDWYNKKLITIDMIKAADLQRKAQKQNKGGSTNNGTNQQHNEDAERAEFIAKIPYSSWDRIQRAKKDLQVQQMQGHGLDLI